MKVVHIGFQYGLNNTGGAAIASTRLHLALLNIGVESHYVCVHQREDGPNVHVLPGRGIVRIVYFALTKVTRCIWKFTSYHRSVCLNIIPMFGLERLLSRIKPDIVHVQWINADVCSFEQLAKLPYRLVFNLHDLYMINAMDVHPKDDFRFVTGFTKSNSSRLERWLFNRKWKLVESSCSKGVSFVGPSNWTASMCQKSLIGKDTPIQVISNLIDPVIKFHREWRKPHEQFTVLFCAFGGRRNSFKGWDDMEAAIRILADKVTDKAGIRIDVCGECSEDTEIAGIKVHFLGVVPEAETLCKVYHSADTLAFPSRQETQGMTKVEALLCGLPVIAFDRTACAEGIVHGQTGWIAADGDMELFAKGILHYYELFCRSLIPHELISRSTESFLSEASTIDTLLKAYAYEMSDEKDFRYVAPELVERTRRAVERNYLSRRTLLVASYHDAIVSPGEGIFDSRGKYVKGSSVHDGWPWEGRKAPENSIKRDMNVVYLGTFNPCWGHCLTDCLQRLWFVCSPDVAKQVKGFTYVYSVSPPDAELPKNFIELLAILGIDFDRLVRVNEPIQFSLIYLPDSCFYLDTEKNVRHFTIEYQSLIKLIIEKICSHREYVADKSVYLSRVGWKSNKEIGEIRIENEFRRMGYEIVRPETMALREIVNLLQSCKRYASTDGSIAHNILFLPAEATVAIIRKASYINGYQDCVNSVNGMNVTYIDANCSNMLYDAKCPWGGPFFLYVNKRLADFTGGKVQFPILDYFRYCFLVFLRRAKARLATSYLGKLKRAIVKNLI